MNKVISGDYVNGKINRRLQLIRGSRIWNLDSNTVSKVKIMDSDERKSLSSAIGRGIVGGALLGPLGMLGGAVTGKNNKSHMVKVYFKDGAESILEINNKVMKAMQIKLKVEY